MNINSLRQPTLCQTLKVFKPDDFNTTQMIYGHKNQELNVNNVILAKSTPKDKIKTLKHNEIRFKKKNQNFIKIPKP